MVRQHSVKVPSAGSSPAPPAKIIMKFDELKDAVLIRTLDKYIIQMRNHFYSDYYRVPWTEHSPKMRDYFELFEAAKQELVKRSLWQDYCDKRGLSCDHSALSVIDREMERLKKWREQKS